MSIDAVKWFVGFSKQSAADMVQTLVEDGSCADIIRRAGELLVALAAPPAGVGAEAYQLCQGKCEAPGCGGRWCSLPPHKRSQYHLCAVHAPAGPATPPGTPGDPQAKGTR